LLIFDVFDGLKRLLPVKKWRCPAQASTAPTPLELVIRPT
jgi:hypothetical protein